MDLRQKRTVKEAGYMLFSPHDLKKRKRSLKIIKLMKNAITLLFAFWLGVMCTYYIYGKFYESPMNIILYPKSNEPVCSAISDLEKFDCYPDAPVTEAECTKRGCCYHALTDDRISNFPPLKTPYCYFPSNYKGYNINNITFTSKGIVAFLQREGFSGFHKDIENLLLNITYIDDYSLRIKITDADSTRFEVPVPTYYKVKQRQAELYNMHLDTNGNLSITRRTTGAYVFKTNLSQLVFSDQFLQISLRLASPFLYGIGEHYDSLMRSVNWTRYTLMNSDLSPIPNHALYGSHPFYMVLESDGNAHGVFLLNSNAMDVVLQPTPAITFRPIGGILDFYVVLGPSPENVVQQYTNIIGKTFMPPYWSLGFHLCRFGYNSLNKTKEVFQRTIDAGIPFDVQWNDIDYMDKHKDFTYDKDNFAGLPEFMDEIHRKGMHYVPMTDPGISGSEKPGTYPPYDDGVKADIFIKDADGKIFEGKVWTSGKTVYPDFSHPAISSYWENQIESFHSQINFDGLWLDMNEPSNFYNGAKNGCPSSPIEDPQYVPGGIVLRTKTICMTAKHYHTIHYNEHNLYGYREVNVTNRILKKIRNKRPFIISRASFPGQGVYGGHWSGDVFSTWKDMRYTIPSMLNFNIYGIPMVGSDICGFNSNTTVELCARWQALGAFYPFSRNHNTDDAYDQDPVALGPLVVEATKKALFLRYLLLPYLYTLFYRSHVYGDTVARPLFFEFPQDKETFNKDEQFLWGPALMIMPSLYPETNTTTAYFPKGFWYDVYDGEKKLSKGQDLTLSADITTINLAFRGGYVIPLQKPETTTTASRKNEFYLFVALNEKNEAVGELYWDDGDSLDTFENGQYNLIKFIVKENTLNSTVENMGYQTNMQLGKFTICSLDKSPKEVTINGEKSNFKFDKNCLAVFPKNLSLLKSFTVIWN